MQETDGIRCIKGVGEKAEKCYQKLGIGTVGELLRHYPHRYDIYQPIQPVADIQEGHVMVLEVYLQSRPTITYAGKLKIVQCQMRDASGSLKVSWYNMPYMTKVLRMGQKYILRGKIVRKYNDLQMQQPKILKREEYYKKLYQLQPVYPLTEGLTNASVQKAVVQALQETDLTGDFIPLEIRKEYELVIRKKALQQIHFPENKEMYGKARKRLVFEEFFLFAMALKQMRHSRKKKSSVYQIIPGQRTEKLQDTLPFQLTKGQQKAWQDIREDMQSGYCMNRLVQGDVGSGKTMVAVMALLAVAENGHQGAIMAPTEVLAVQHFETFQDLLKPLGIRVGCLTGSMTGKERKKVQEKILQHELDIVVGTHALIQDKVLYADLALVVTDEQHRFGVKQRESFYAKGKEPHMLVMSATPIPRTLAMILYGDLDISVIKELPKGRLPIQNCVVDTKFRAQSYRFLQKEVEKGHQGYIICPMVEESESMEAENVVDYATMLQTQLPPSTRVEILHGKLSAKEKNRRMERFSQGEIDVLVSTTVVEVGVNVPNATVMMVENAERFGLAQLHQLRGRVGRGSAQSYCIFMMGVPSKDTKKRLQVLEDSNDGFYVADKDLQLRGPGDLFGIRQSGQLDFQLADIYQDAEILQNANAAAEKLTDTQCVELCKKYEALREKLQYYAGDVFL